MRILPSIAACVVAAAPLAGCSALLDFDGYHLGADAPDAGTDGPAGDDADAHADAARPFDLDATIDAAPDASPSTDAAAEVAADGGPPAFPDAGPGAVDADAGPVCIGDGGSCTAWLTCCSGLACHQNACTPLSVCGSLPCNGDNDCCATGVDKQVYRCDHNGDRATCSTTCRASSTFNHVVGCTVDSECCSANCGTIAGVGACL